MRDIGVKFDIPNSLNSRGIVRNSDGAISNFRIFDQSLIKVYSHNSRTNDDIQMKLGLVSTIDKGNKTTSKKGNGNGN